MNKTIQIQALTFGLWACVSLFMAVPAYASPTQQIKKISEDVARWMRPSSNEDYRQLRLSELDQIEFNPTVQASPLPVFGASNVSNIAVPSTPVPAQVMTKNSTLSIEDAVKWAVQRHPSIAQRIANLAGQNANIDVAKAAYYPQLSGQVRTGDFTSDQRGMQVLALDASQLVYDFGKVKNSVNIEEQRLRAQQAEVLVQIDDIAEQTARTVLNTVRYQRLLAIHQAQLKGLERSKPMEPYE